MLKTKGFNVIYTRDSDSVPWSATSEDDAKATIAKNAKAHVYLSINTNTYSNASVKGIETYYSPGVSNNKILAGFIQSELIKATEATNRGIKEAVAGVTFDILRKTSCPTVVMELGFLSNPEEATLLSSEAYQNNAAKAIASGLMNYGGFENTDDKYDSIFAISSVEDITVELEKGSKYVFPKTIKATMSNDSKKDVVVQWSKDSVNLDSAGTYTYEGVIKGYDKTVKVIINVLKANIKEYKVVIDAGHGGHDSGAVGPKGIQEKTIALAISLKVGSILTKNGVETVYTRESDVIPWSTNETKNLQQRCDISNAAKPDYFISIHVNSAEMSTASGIETYYKDLDTEGQKLAKAVQTELIKETGRKDRGIKTAGFYVLKYTNVTSILVERAFISNPEEEQLLTTQEYQNKLAKAISTGILKSLGITNIVY